MHRQNQCQLFPALSKKCTSVNLLRHFCKENVLPLRPENTLSNPQHPTFNL